MMKKITQFGVHLLGQDVHGTEVDVKESVGY